MLKVLQVRIKEQVAGSGIQNMPSLTDWEDSSTNRKTNLNNSISSQYPSKWLGF